MQRYAVAAAKFFAEDGVKEDVLLLVEGGRFGDFVSRQQAESMGIEIKEYPDCYVLPGLVDTHLHGAMGSDVMDGTPEALGKIGRFLLSQGTTSWLPTTVTSPFNEIVKAAANVAAAEMPADAARVLGCFVEGPYFTAEHRGAHREDLLRELSLAELRELAACGSVRAVAAAPEKKGIQEFIKEALSLGIKISLGHSSADYQEAMAAIKAGADAAVHTFCGMSTMHHRRPMLLGAVLTEDEVYTEVIADGLHVSLPALKILLRCKPKDKIILISDALSSTGLPDGEYRLGLEPITLQDGVSRTKDGALAGSTAVLLAEGRRLIFELQVEPLDAIKMASLNPCRRFGFDDEIGSIRKGKKADFLLTDKKYCLFKVAKEGTFF